jgi:energy-coupling factor transporter ATP-binding protein EcfA2
VRLTFVRPYKSITEAVSEDDLGELIVLSGPNGSGKSHLLEAIEQGAIVVQDVPPGPNPSIRLFRLAQLVAVAEGNQAAASFRDNWAALANQADALTVQFTSAPNNIPPASDQLEQMIVGSLVTGRQTTQRALDRLKQDAGKRLIDFTKDDFRRFAPLVMGVRDPFQFSVGELFLTYHERKTRNEMYQWQLATRGVASGTPLTDEEFAHRYGPPPWDLMNETLGLVGLSYIFNHPDGAEDNLNFEAQLTDPATGISIRTEHLSAGEKTLMAVAMSLYTGARLGDVMELPRVLLLDEADASLHPSMVQSLIRVAEDVFVARYGVNVILTTHSPTTVALAPEDALYLMRRSDRPRLRRADSRDEALHALTVGLSTLSVRIENRRQVFVESEHDEDSYQELYRLLQSRISSPISLQFIASGKGGQGNSDAVRHLVGAMRGAGNTTVFGIVDRDQRGGAPDGVLFASERYAIENFVLDPVVVGAFLIRERMAPPEELGVAPGTRHLDINGLHAEPISMAVLEMMERDDDDRTQVVCNYVGGFTCSLPRWYLDLPGHELERRLAETFPPLRRCGTLLKHQVVTKALRDLPDLIPAELLELFRHLAT